MGLHSTGGRPQVPPGLQRQLDDTAAAVSDLVPTVESLQTPAPEERPRQTPRLDELDAWKEAVAADLAALAVRVAALETLAGNPPRLDPKKPPKP